MPTLGWGKHSLRLYAGAVSGRCPVPQPLRGGRKEHDMPREKQKTDIITMRIQPRFKELIRQKAEEAGMTVTDYLCICGLGQQIVRVDGLDAILSELKAQGRNLNQLTTLANMGKIKILRGSDIIESYQKLYQEVSELAKAVK